MAAVLRSMSSDGLFSGSPYSILHAALRLCNLTKYHTNQCRLQCSAQYHRQDPRTYDVSGPLMTGFSASFGLPYKSPTDMMEKLLHRRDAPTLGARLKSIHWFRRDHLFGKPNHTQLFKCFERWHHCRKILALRLPSPFIQKAFRLGKVLNVFRSRSSLSNWVSPMSNVPSIDGSLFFECGTARYTAWPTIHVAIPDTAWCWYSLLGA